MAKSADAFRTISEVADWLETPAHVLRFWESKFSQVKPVKRAGGRRYYRPADMKLLGGIKKLLHDDGMTIKGVQKLLREQGVAHVAELSQPLGDAADEDTLEQTATSAAPAPKSKDSPAPEPPKPAAPEPAAEEPASEADVPLTFSRRSTPEPETEPDPEPTQESDAPEASPPLPSFLQRREDTPAPETKSAVPAAPPPAPEPEPEPEKPKPAQVTVPDDPEDTVEADPGVLGAVARLPRRLSRADAQRLAPLVAKLRSASGPSAKD